MSHQNSTVWYVVFAVVVAALTQKVSADDSGISLEDATRLFENPAAMNVATPPFEEEAIANGVTPLQLLGLYRTWAVESEVLPNAEMLVALLEARVASIWSGRTTGDRVRYQFTVADDEPAKNEQNYDVRAELEWSGDRYRSSVVKRSGGLPGAEVITGTVVSNGREVLVMDELRSSSAVLHPVTDLVLRRSRLSLVQLLTEVQASRSEPSRSDWQRDSHRRDMVAPLRWAMENGVLFVLPETVIVDETESLVVIDMSQGGQRYYFLSLEHQLAPVRIEAVRLNFSEHGAYVGREVTIVQSFHGLHDAGDGLFLPELTQRSGRLWRRGRDGDGPERLMFTYERCVVDRAEINRGATDRTFYIHHAGRGRIIDDRVRGVRWAFNADGAPDVGEAILLANDLRRETNVEVEGVGPFDGQGPGESEGRRPMTLEMVEGIREGMMCTVVAGFVALHQLGVDVSMHDVAAQIGWESGSPRTARDMANAMAALAGVHSDLRRVTREEPELLLSEEETAVLLLLDLHSADVGHISAVVGSESDGALVTAEYPQLQRLLTPDELGARWTGEVLIVSLAAADVTAPLQQAKARGLYLAGAVVALAAGLAFLLVGRKPRREAVPC